jgi:diguanylate cyclase (GGDEF)-like protein/PAS domain S-box-containing protein
MFPQWREPPRQPDDFGAVADQNLKTMIIQPEQLLETLLDLERSRQREREIRLEAEALLEGLRGITGADEREGLFQSLVVALGSVIEFEEAFILEAADAETMLVLAATFDAVKGSVWRIGPVFRKALIGKPVASFDISLVPEWAAQPPEVIAGISSALHIGLRGKGWAAILVATHSHPKHFGPGHVKKALRFSPLAAQALLTLELRKAVIERDRFFQLSPDAMAIFTMDGIITQHNRGWANSFGDDGMEHQANILELIHPEDGGHFQEIMGALRNREGKRPSKMRFRQQSGNYHWFSCSIAVYHDQMLYYIVARDITESVLFEQKLAYQAGHDSLTGLKNRAEFMDSLQTAFARYQEDMANRFALLFLDLNKFKAINDTLGHDIGDELLKAFAGTLQESVRSDDIVSRLGGDEFTILLTKIQSLADVETIAHRIRQKCRTPYVLKEHRLTASTSIGITVSAPEYRNEQEMLHAADLAMYTAKQDTTLPFWIHQGPLQCALPPDQCPPGETP